MTFSSSILLFPSARALCGVATRGGVEFPSPVGTLVLRALLLLFRLPEIPFPWPLLLETGCAWNSVLVFQLEAQAAFFMMPP